MSSAAGTFGWNDWTSGSTEPDRAAVVNVTVDAQTGGGLPWPPQSYVAPGDLSDLSPSSQMDDGLQYDRQQEVEVVMCGAMAQMETALGCALIPVLSVLGAVGNGLCVMVFLRQRYHSVVKPLLLAICVSDVLFLLCSFLVCVPKMVGKVDAENGRVLNVVLTPQLGVLRDVMGRMTVVLSLAIGVERSVTVTRPFKLRALCTTPRTRTAVLAIYLAVLALMVPLFFRYDVIEHRVEPNNVTRLGLHRTPFYLDNRAAMDHYADYFLPAILRLMPFIGSCACFAVILVSFKRRLQCRAGPSQAPRHGAFARARLGAGHAHIDESAHADLVLEERKLTRALLTVLFICILCEVLGLATRFTHVIQSDIRLSKRFSSAYLTAHDLGDLLEVINSAVNFPIFMVTYKHFSVTFHSLAGFCRRN